MSLAEKAEAIRAWKHKRREIEREASRALFVQQEVASKRRDHYESHPGFDVDVALMLLEGRKVAVETPVAEALMERNNDVVAVVVADVQREASEDFCEAYGADDYISFRFEEESVTVVELAA